MSNDATACPGREFDALVAERVMGWTAVGCESNSFHTEFVPHGVPSVGARRKMLPDYSTDIAAAWLVVEAMRERDYGLELYCAGKSELWQARFVRRVVPDYAWGDTAPLAICRAALAAVEVPAHG